MLRLLESHQDHNGLVSQLTKQILLKEADTIFFETIKLKDSQRNRSPHSLLQENVGFRARIFPMIKQIARQIVTRTGQVKLSTRPIELSPIERVKQSKQIKNTKSGHLFKDFDSTYGLSNL